MPEIDDAKTQSPGMWIPNHWSKASTSIISIHTLALRWAQFQTPAADAYATVPTQETVPASEDVVESHTTANGELQEGEDDAGQGAESMIL